MDYPGKVITKTAVTPTQTSATGVWTLDDAAAAVKNNNWPVAGVPNPISKSLRFNSADSAYLNRTFSTPTSNYIWTWSAWIKRSTLGTDQTLFGVAAGNSGNTGSTPRGSISWDAANTLSIFANDGSTTFLNIVTTPVFRDASAWYHVMFVLDTTQATNTNRVKIYINGVQQTVTGTYPNQNVNTIFNGTSASKYHSLGMYANLSQFANGYLTEVNFIDGQALTPSSFGMTDPQTGAWIPIKYTGTYGTNGFYLNFKDATSTTTLGYDYSGNANNWTTNNFSVTAGAGNDSLIDVPTPWIAYNTTGDVGGVVRGNYATLNPLTPPVNGSLSNGNLLFTGATDWGGSKSTIAIPTTGKWYAEFTLGSTSSNSAQADVGIFISGNTNYYDWTGSYGLEVNNVFFLITNGSYSSARSGTTAGGTVLQIAVDADAGKVWFGVANAWYDTFNTTNGNPGAGTNPSGSSINFSTTTYFMGVKTDFNNWTANFGQRPFAYTPPAGFLSLCTTNLPNPTIGTSTTTQAGKYFNPVLYTGNGSTQSITGVGFQPDFVWIKNRGTATDHGLFDAIRGTTKRLSSNLTNAETTEVNSLTAFNSDGFSVGATQDFNQNTVGIVAWNWNAGGSNQTISVGQYATSPANVPSIASTVRANTTSGFSIVTYTGNGTGGATIGHGIGIAPSMIIVKRRDGGSGYSWHVQHVSTGNTRALFLDSTSAGGTSNVYWNSTSPTSTVFTAGTDTSINANTGTFVAYCFAAVAGYSAFGSYTGNGSTDGPFVYTGFRPRYLMLKRTNAASVTYGWQIYDAARSPYNQALLPGLWADTSAAEAANTYGMDLLSNGFKLRSSGVNENGSGDTYIYAAFAEFPFKFANAR